MEPLVKKIRRLLRKEYPLPDEIELENSDGIIAKVVSSRFKNLEPLDRVNLLWDYLEQHLSRDEFRKIVVFLPMTPTEKLLHST